MKFKIGDKVRFKGDITQKVYVINGADYERSHEVYHLYMIDSYRHWFFDFELEPAHEYYM